MIEALSRIESIERSALAALPALTEIEAPGWVCRLSGGPTKRVNSVNPVVAGARLDEVWTIAERAYADAGLPLRYRLTPLAAAGCDEALALAGFALVDPSLTMTAPLIPRAVPPGVTLADRPDAGWCAGLAAASGWSTEQDQVHRALLDRLPAGSVVASVDDGDGKIAFGAAGLGHGRVCLFDIAVVMGARGRGVGRRLVEGLLGWAAASDRDEALLHVFETNTPARSLYRSLGFVDAYPYHYRIR